jgi:hypothetical protein
MIKLNRFFNTDIVLIIILLKMKSLALFGFILLGAVNAHRLADSETLFLNGEDI